MTRPIGSPTPASSTHRSRWRRSRATGSSSAPGSVRGGQGGAAAGAEERPAQHRVVDLVHVGHVSRRHRRHAQDDALVSHRRADDVAGRTRPARGREARRCRCDRAKPGRLLEAGHRRTRVHADACVIVPGARDASSARCCAQRYALEGGRVIARDGQALVRLERVDLGNERYALSPHETDKLGARIVRLLNRRGVSR